MDKNNVLLAFKDDDEISKATGYLARAGFEVRTVKDGARALELAIGEVPAIIIVDLDLPIISGERIFHILRNNPHTSNVPFLFVSDRVADIKGFRSGVDIFLRRPLNMEEVNGRIRHTLAIQSRTTDRKELEGNLTHISLPDILQFLHFNKKEGELRVICGEMVSTVFIKEGEIYNCVLDGVEKEKALFRVLGWNEGKFEFLPGPVKAAKKIESSTGNLLMEGMRQIDEFRKQQDHFPDKNTALKTRLDSASLPKGLNPIIYEVIELLKVYTTVNDVVEHASYPDYEAYKSLSSLISKGIVEEVKVREEGRSKEFLTHDQAVSIREKILSHYSDIFNPNYCRVFLISTSGSLASAFIKQCSLVSGFSINHKVFRQAPLNPFGDVASIKLHGGMEVALFSMPFVNNMGPILKAFSTNLIGLVLLWDNSAGMETKELVNAKKEILQQRRVPVAHICKEPTGQNGSIGSFYKKEFDLKIDEPLFSLDGGEKGNVFEVFYSLFGNLMKEDYVAV